MGWCDHCCNTGELDCYCGGDLCVCSNNGTYPCPYCDSVQDYDDDGGPLEAEETMRSFRERALRKRGHKEGHSGDGSPAGDKG